MAAHPENMIVVDMCAEEDRERSKRLTRLAAINNALGTIEARLSALRAEKASKMALFSAVCRGEGLFFRCSVPFLEATIPPEERGTAARFAGDVTADLRELSAQNIAGLTMLGSSVEYGDAAGSGATTSVPAGVGNNGSVGASLADAFSFPSARTLTFDSMDVAEALYRYPNVVLERRRLWTEMDARVMRDAVTAQLRSIRNDVKRQQQDDEAMESKVGGGGVGHDAPPRELESYIYDVNWEEVCLALNESRLTGSKNGIGGAETRKSFRSAKMGLRTSAAHNSKDSSGAKASVVRPSPSMGPVANLYSAAAASTIPFPMLLSALDCYLFWTYELSRSNNAAWSAEEDAALITAVERGVHSRVVSSPSQHDGSNLWGIIREGAVALRGGVDWRVVTSVLGTKRSPFVVLQRYVNTAAGGSHSMHQQMITAIETHLVLEIIREQGPHWRYASHFFNQTPCLPYNEAELTARPAGGCLLGPTVVGRSRDLGAAVPWYRLVAVIVKWIGTIVQYEFCGGCLWCRGQSTISDTSSVGEAAYGNISGSPGSSNMVGTLLPHRHAMRRKWQLKPYGMDEVALQLLLHGQSMDIPGTNDASLDRYPRNGEGEDDDQSKPAPSVFTLGASIFPFLSPDAIRTFRPSWQSQVKTAESWSLQEEHSLMKLVEERTVGRHPDVNVFTFCAAFLRQQYGHTRTAECCKMRYYKISDQQRAQNPAGDPSSSHHRLDSTSLASTPCTMHPPREVMRRDEGAAVMQTSGRRGGRMRQEHGHQGVDQVGRPSFTAVLSTKEVSLGWWSDVTMFLRSAQHAPGSNQHARLLVPLHEPSIRRLAPCMAGRITAIMEACRGQQTTPAVAASPNVNKPRRAQLRLMIQAELRRRLGTTTNPSCGVNRNVSPEERQAVQHHGGTGNIDGSMGGCLTPCPMVSGAAVLRCASHAGAADCSVPTTRSAGNSGLRVLPGRMPRSSTTEWEGALLHSLYASNTSQQSPSITPEADMQRRYESSQVYGALPRSTRDAAAVADQRIHSASLMIAGLLGQRFLQR